MGPELGLWFGIGCAVFAAVVVVGLMIGSRRGEAKRLETLRREGTVCSAVIKQIVGRGPNVGITFDITTSSGRVGRAFGGLGDRGFDFAWLTDAFATGKPVELLFHPDVPTVMIKHPTGEFR